MNSDTITKVQTVARILGYKTESEEAFGKKVTSMDGVRLMDLKNHYTVSASTATANAVVKKGISRTIGGDSGATTGLTDIYAVKFDINDGFHAATLAGSNAQRKIKVWKECDSEGCRSAGGSHNHRQEPSDWRT